MKSAIELTEKQKKLIEVIQNNPKLPYRSIAVKLKINESAVLKHINVLKKKGVLTRIGGTRGHWQVA